MELHESVYIEGTGGLEGVIYVPNLVQNSHMTFY